MIVRAHEWDFTIHISFKYSESVDWQVVYCLCVFVCCTFSQYDSAITKFPEWVLITGIQAAVGGRKKRCFVTGNSVHLSSLSFSLQAQHTHTHMCTHSESYEAVVKQGSCVMGKHTSVAWLGSLAQSEVLSSLPESPQRLDTGRLIEVTECYLLTFKWLKQPLSDILISIFKCFFHPPAAGSCVFSLSFPAGDQ